MESLTDPETGAELTAESGAVSTCPEECCGCCALYWRAVNCDPDQQPQVIYLFRGCPGDEVVRPKYDDGPPIGLGDVITFGVGICYQIESELDCTQLPDDAVPIGAAELDCVEACDRPPCTEPQPCDDYCYSVDEAGQLECCMGLKDANGDGQWSFDAIHSYEQLLQYSGGDPPFCDRPDCVDVRTTWNTVGQPRASNGLCDGPGRCRIDRDYEGSTERYTDDGQCSPDGVTPINGTLSLCPPRLRPIGVVVIEDTVGPHPNCPEWLGGLRHTIEIVQSTCSVMHEIETIEFYQPVFTGPGVCPCQFKRTQTWETIINYTPGPDPTGCADCIEAGGGARARRGPVFDPGVTNVRPDTPLPDMRKPHHVKYEKHMRPTGCGGCQKNRGLRGDEIRALLGE